MDPNQNQYSIDYLNQISAPVKKPGMSNKLVMIIVGAGVLIAIIAGLSLLRGGSSNTQKLQTLAARLETLQSITKSSQTKIKNGTLRTTNSTLSLTLAGAIRDIATPLQNNGGDGKIDKTITASEDGTRLKATLENARLNAVFDRTYAREMSYQLATVTSLIKEIHAGTSSKSLKAFLTTTDTNLKPIETQLAEFNAANG